MKELLVLLLPPSPSNLQIGPIISWIAKNNSHILSLRRFALEFPEVMQNLNE